MRPDGSPGHAKVRALLRIAAYDQYPLGHEHPLGDAAPGGSLCAPVLSGSVKDQRSVVVSRVTHRHAMVNGSGRSKFSLSSIISGRESLTSRVLPPTALFENPHVAIARRLQVLA